MERREFPILEYDPSEIAIIEPKKVFQENKLSDYCVLTWFQQTINLMEQSGIVKKHIKLDTTAIVQWIYEYNYKGNKIALINPNVGGPISAMCFETAIARGYKKFIAVGGAGVLEPKLKVGKIVIIDSAIRDEGTSYHYLPASREIKVNQKILKIMEKELITRKIDHVVGKTWTTDAIFRETPEKIKIRKQENALIVEMEAASLISIAQFRDISLGYLICCGDDVSGEEWDVRKEVDRKPIQERMIDLACDLVLKL